MQTCTANLKESAEITARSMVTSAHNVFTKREETVDAAVVNAVAAAVAATTADEETVEATQFAIIVE